jgi:WD40 repeat protein
MEVVHCNCSYDLATGSLDGYIRLWGTHSTDPASAAIHISTRTVTRRIYDGHNVNPTRALTAIQFSPNGRWLVACDDDQIHMFEMDQSGSAVTTVRRGRGHTEAVVAIMFNDSCELMMTLGLDSRVKLWDVESGREINSVIRVLLDEIICGCFSPAAFNEYNGSSSSSNTAASSVGDGMVATGMYSGVLELWNGFNGSAIWRLRGHCSQINSVVFNNGIGTDLIVASGGSDGTVIVWDVSTGAQRHTLRLHVGPVTSLAFHCDGCKLMSGSKDATGIIWDTNDGRVVGQLRRGVAEITAVSFSAEGTYACCGRGDGTITIWDISHDEGPRLENELHGHTKTITSLCYVPCTNILM